jgi:hypothetical protein
VILIVNSEEQLSIALAGTGASSSIILKAYSSFQFIKTDDSYTSETFPFIKTDKNNTTTWSVMSGKFTTIKNGICL